MEGNEKGGHIEIITLDELLAIPGTDRRELDSMEPMNVSYLLDDKYKKPETA